MTHTKYEMDITVAKGAGRAGLVWGVDAALAVGGTSIKPGIYTVTVQRGTAKTISPFPIPAPSSKFPSELHAERSHQAHSAHNLRRRATDLRRDAEECERQASEHDKLAWDVQAEIDTMCMECEGAPCIHCAGTGWKTRVKDTSLPKRSGAHQ